MLGLLSTTAKSSMRPPMVAGPISRNSRFFSLSTGLAWSAGAAGTFAASALMQMAIPEISRRAFEPCFISFPHAQGPACYSCRPISRIICFWKGKQTLCNFRRATLLSRFHCTPTPSPSIPIYPVLGYPTAFIDCMVRMNLHFRARALSALRFLVFLIALLAALACPATPLSGSQQVHLPASKSGIAELEAKTQSRRGDVTTADGDVDIRYGDTRLRADHVEYNSKTFEAVATGHVLLDYNNEHLEADEAHYNVSTGHGLFHNVRGSVKIERRPNPAILISDNPLYFEARDVERFAGDVYLVHRAWITICDPLHPKWQFYAPNARIHLGKTVALINANFRLLRVPLIWLPYATAPAGRRVRQTGFLVPDIGQSSRKGFILGDAFYWAPKPWMDATLGLQFMSRRGLLERGEFRAFSLNFASLNDKSFLTLPVAATPSAPAIPATSVALRNAPEARFGSVEQAPWRKVPVYFGFDAFAGAVNRSDDEIQTPDFVYRYEFAPRVTIPVHLGPWLGVTTSAAFRATRYGDSLNAAGLVSGTSISRHTGEFTVDLRPPVLERYFDGCSSKKDKSGRRFKHTIEPVFTYRYVTGVNNFADFIRFNSNATITDTNEIQYGFTQRLFLKEGDGQPEEVLSWSISQKHYFDPTFGGAIVNGQRNVFQALDSITPFAFAFGPRNWSPIISDFKITPGGRYDVEQILQYDPHNQRLVTIGTLLKVKPYREFFTTIAHFRLDDNPSLSDLQPPSPLPTFQQPLSNQIRALAGYGSETRKGLNFTVGVSYDFTNKILQNQIVQASYNGSCCGLAIEYRRINLGQVRTENQFRIAFMIANIGTFGNLRHHEKIY